MLTISTFHTATFNNTHSQHIALLCSTIRHHALRSQEFHFQIKLFTEKQRIEMSHMRVLTC